ncbi:MAG: hypothetical protein ACRDWG_07790 [Actinomycetes bacterium]|jgi:uncharacterized protein involved in exopolysaccharide biosynthesis
MNRTPPLALGWYRGFARRYLFVIADCALIGILVTVGILLLSPLSYRGTVTVVLSAMPAATEDPESAGRSLAIDIDAQIASSSTVLQAAAAQTDFPGGADALARSLRLTALPNAHALLVRVSSGDRAKAMAAAQAISLKLLTVRGQTLDTRLRAHRVALRLQIAMLSARLAAPLLDEQREQISQALSNLQQSLAELKAQSSSPGFVTGPPTGSRSARPGLQAKLASGAMLGGLLGVGLAALLETVRSARRDQRLRHAGPVTDQTRRAA